jgi:hypothetical protein
MSTSVRTATEIRPFHLEIPEERLDDLRRRVEATRWPSRELVDDRSQGVQLAALQALARYWTTDYDWRACEARLNALPQFTTEIDGVEIHFIHVRSPTRGRAAADHDARLARLGDRAARDRRPADRPDRARRRRRGRVPPGAAVAARLRLLGEPAEIGWDAGRVAQAWAELMHRLGYSRYVAQGGDVGAAVTDAMGRQAPDGLLGIHTNLLVPALGIGQAPGGVRAGSAPRAMRSPTFRATGFGYFLEQATRPQTIGYACWIHPSRSRPGCSTTTRTATTRSPAPSWTTSRPAI